MKSKHPALVLIATNTFLSLYTLWKAYQPDGFLNSFDDLSWPPGWMLALLIFGWLLPCVILVFAVRTKDDDSARGLTALSTIMLGAGLFIGVGMIVLISFLTPAV